MGKNIGEKYVRADITLIPLLTTDVISWGILVKQILTNPIYLGNLVQLKTYTLSYKNKKQVKNEPEDMVTVYNTHEAIAQAIGK
jgi:hypothetical protein